MEILMRRFAMMIGLTTALCSTLAYGAETKSFSPEQTKEIEKIIKSYLIAHPQVIAEAVEALQKQEEAQAAIDAKQKIASVRADLIQAGDDIVLGNPNGDITMVEFYDYRCGYCKAVVDAVHTLVKGDGKLRLVLRSYPVLGPDSLVAAKAVFASRVQGQDKQLAFHDALMAVKGSVDEAKILSVAKETGLDIDKLKIDMADARIAGLIEKNRNLGTKLGVNGTPTFVLGDKVMPGVDTADNFRKAVDAARKGS
jgi:protein-disulfide isomerase